MTTREEAKLLDPEETFWVGFHEVYVDNDVLGSFLINWFFEIIKGRKRARLVVHEDAIRATGIWTPEEAGDVASRLIVGKSGNFEDPQRKKGISRLFQYLGFTK